MRKPLKRHLSSLVIVLLMASCSSGGNGRIDSLLPSSPNGASGSASGTAPERIYVALLANAVNIFDASANGDVPPVKRLSFETGCLNIINAEGVTVDLSGNVYISVPTAIAIYNVSPTTLATRTVGVLQGPHTHLDQPEYLAQDHNQNIYATTIGGPSGDTGAIVEYAAGTKGGDVSPIAHIQGSNTDLTPGFRGPVAMGIALDRHDNIFVMKGNVTTGFDTAPDEILEFPAGSNGNVAPVARIVGSSTHLDGGTGIALDQDGNIYVANQLGHSVAIYASGSNGNVAPIRTIAGSNTTLDGPTGIAVDASGKIFVADGDAVSGRITVFAPGATGNVAPIDTIVGENANIVDPGEVFVR